jgi:hypothetical protein
MAKMVLTAAGMAAGFAIGGPMGAQIGAMIGGEIGNILFPTKVQGPRLSDLSVSASTYGNAIAELYGTMRLNGNVIWSSGIKEHKHKSSGKGSGVQQTTYTYTASFAIAFCKGDTAAINRIWADGKMIAGQKPIGVGGTINLADTLNLTKGSKGKFNYRFYTGSENQMPDETIEAALGAGNAPAYRDLCYLVFIDMPLVDFGNRIPQITAEITRQPIVTAPYIDLASDTTNYGAVTNWNGSTPDFLNNKLYKLVNDGGVNYFATFDLRTMQELYRVPVQPVKSDDLDPVPASYPSTFNPCFSIGGNFFWDNTSLHNSGTGEIWNATTGEGIVRIGHMSNSFPANVQPDPTQPYDPKKALIGTWSATCLWFRILDITSNGTIQDDYLWQTGNIGGGIVFDAFGYPVHAVGVPFGNACSWVPMRGKEDPGALVSGAPASTDLLLLNQQFVGGIGHDVVLHRVHLIALAKMTGSPALGNNMANYEDTVTLPRPVLGEDWQFMRCAYDRSDNGIVIWGKTGADVNTASGGKWCFAKYMIDEGTYKWVKVNADLDQSLAIGVFGDAGESVGIPVSPANQSNLNGGSVGWMRGPAFTNNPAALYVADLQTGNITLAAIPSPLSGYYTAEAWPFNAWDDDTKSVLGLPARVFINQQGDGVSLQSIVDDILTKTRALDPGDWASSALAGITVKGYAISRDTTARDVLLQLAGAYFFDGVESDYILKMIMRGGAPVATINEKYLSWVKDKDTSVKETRAQEVEIPMRVTINYCDVDRNYQSGAQSAKRNANPFPTMHSHSEAKVDLPIAMTATEAKQIADKGLKMSWTNRVTYDLKMPWEFLKYDPTDVISVTTSKGNTYEMRLAKIAMGVDFTLQTAGTADIAAAYTSTAVGDPGTGVPSQIINVGGPVDVFILNTPLLRDIDDTQGVASVFYATAKGKSPGTFTGAYLLESTDPFGTNYDNLDRFATEPTWGIAANALPPHVHYGIDTTSVLTVRMMSLADDNNNYDVLDTCTLTDLLNGSNVALVGDEIIQFMTATLQPDGRTYKLSNLLRARRGTNYAVPYHKAGETFIMLEAKSMVREVNTPAEWSARHLFKGVATGEYAENVQPIGITMQPNDLKPYTPECVKATDDGTNVTINFERRSRIGSEIHDGDGDVPYREGQGSLAHFVYKVYAGKTLADLPWSDSTVTPDFTGQVPIYSGLSFAPLTFAFALGGITEFVVEIHEVGFVDGFPKIVQFVRERPNDWAITELY